MKTAIDRRHVLHAGIAAGVSLITPRAKACEFFTRNLRIIHPWSRATGEDSTSVAVCMTFTDVMANDRLIGAESPVCSGAEMGGEGAQPFVDILIPEGQTTVLSEAGTHLRLVGLQRELPAGREYPLTLIFEIGGPASARLTIDYKRFG